MFSSKWAGIKILCLDFAVVAFLTANNAAATTISSPTIVGSYGEMASQTSDALAYDAPLSSFKVPNGVGGYYLKWIGTGVNPNIGSSIRLVHTLYGGDQDFPLGSIEWEKLTCAYQNGYCGNANGAWVAFTASNVGYVKNDDLWFTSVHQPDPDQPELLAFIHEEHINGSSSENTVGYTGLGLAWSNDYGNSWKYLGRIISADSNFDAPGFNIQGTPYIINGEYIYIYFSDVGGLTTARARLSDVLANARSGWSDPGLWNKYNNGLFNSLGIGGASTNIGIDGINHTQAAYSTHTGKYYLVLSSMAWGAGDTYVSLFESTNGYSGWTKTTAIAHEPNSSQFASLGYQYCSLSDSSGHTNSSVGQKMFVYCMKNPMVGANRALYRWEINLVPSAGYFYRQSTDFSSSEGPYWQYRFGPDISAMSWEEGDHWQGIDPWSRIYSDILHPGHPGSGNYGIPVLTWTAPQSGWIHIDGTVRKKDISCGDGIYASAAHNGTTIFQSSHLDYNNNVGESIDRSQATRWVNASDGLYFMVSSGSNNYCDSTYWDPSITYQ